MGKWFYKSISIAMRAAKAFAMPEARQQEETYYVYA